MTTRLVTINEGDGTTSQVRVPTRIRTTTTREPEQEQQRTSNVTTQKLGATDQAAEDLANSSTASGPRRAIPVIGSGDPERDAPTTRVASSPENVRRPTPLRGEGPLLPGQRRAAPMRVLRADESGPLARGQRRETAQEQRRRLDSEFLTRERRQRLAGLARAVPDEFTGKQELIEKIQTGKKLNAAEVELMLDSIEFRAQTLKLVDDIASERIREDALAEIISGTVEVAAVLVPPARVGTAARTVKIAGQRAKLGPVTQSGPARVLPKREAQRLARAFLNTKASKFLDPGARRKLRQAAVSNAIRLSKPVRGSLSKPVGGTRGRVGGGGSKFKAGGGVRKVTPRPGGSVRKQPGVARPPITKPAPAPALKAEKLTAKQANLIAQPKTQLRRKVQTEVKTIKQLQKARVTKPLTAAQAQRLAQAQSNRRLLLLALGLGAAAIADIVQKPGATTSPSLSPTAQTGPAGGPQQQTQPVTATTTTTKVATTTGGPRPPGPGPGPPPPTTPILTPGQRPTGKGRPKPPLPGSDEPTEATIKLPAGKDPEVIGFRLGKFERVENLKTGQQRVGSDLSPAIPNDPTASPAETVRVFNQAKKGSVKFPSRRNLGIVDRLIDRTGPRETTIRFVRSKKANNRRAKSPKLVRRKGE